MNQTTVFLLAAVLVMKIHIHCFLLLIITNALTVIMMVIITTIISNDHEHNH